jgi:phosphoglycerate dehydrogenase-like enzyme
MPNGATSSASALAKAVFAARTVVGTVKPGSGRASLAVVFRHRPTPAPIANSALSSPMPLPRIVVVPPTFAEIAELARTLAPSGFELVIVRSEHTELEAALATAEYLVCYPNVRTSDTFYRAAPSLRLHQLLSAGYDDVDLEAARRAKVPVSNNGGANAISVAEHAMMLMLMVSRRVISQHANVSGGRWRGNGPAPRMYEIHDKTLGIIGLGTIGKKVARLARAFGMRVQYYDIVRMTEDAEDALGVRFRLMGELLAISDIVTLHVPLNTTTRHMIGAHELASMKPEAIIVNTSRGPVIDEAALARALADNKLFGAGLDVFDQEPPPPDNPLFALKNVVLTSHFAGPTWDNQIARLRNAYDNVQRVARGEPPLWVVPELSDLVR